ncbi:dephospho-CoA kinase [Apostasia shenzhenica]|uniref:Dephospho-CoA kinase n=1 Tax=Apostasia shenzhenica TaxID=1088818 RepID=A0A2I0AMP8_9ASPA|nr:dephospho-CoA kinase [Apostasia shenzhenica]
MRIVGLTGGIASGKSTVSDLFKSNGFPVVDADLVARVVRSFHSSFHFRKLDAVRKETPGWRKVVNAFSNEILLESGEINRSHLGQIVFSDPTKRQLLNRLLAPHISSGIFWKIVKLWAKGSKVIVLDIPLLFEAKMDRWTKPIIVVWVDPETQLQRLMSRDRISEEEARNRIDAQTSLDSKKTKADIVIDNSGSTQNTRMEFQKKSLVENFKIVAFRVPANFAFPLEPTSHAEAYVALLTLIALITRCFAMPTILIHSTKEANLATSSTWVAS